MKTSSSKVGHREKQLLMESHLSHQIQVQVGVDCNSSIVLIIKILFFEGGCNVEGESESWDFGVGAGFYVNATQPKWKENWNMYSYITEELLSIVIAQFPIRSDRIAVSGHRYWVFDFIIYTSGWEVLVLFRLL